MMNRKIALGAMCSILGALSATSAVLTYDFADAPVGGDWNGSFSHTVSNYTLAGVGQIDSMKRPVGHAEEWQGDFIYMYAYSNEEIGTITLNSNGVNSAFIVHSLHANTGQPEGVFEIKGMLEGEEQWILLPTTNWVNGEPKPIYTTATTGEMSDPVDQLICTLNTNLWGQRLDDIVLEPTVVIQTQEVIYEWSLNNYWTPHGVWNWVLSASDFGYIGEAPYWWGGYQSTNDANGVISHRPGWEDLPDGTVNGGVTNDLLVGGLGERGLWVTNSVRTLVTNETLEVTFDYKLFVNDGPDDGRFMDIFFSTVGDDSLRFLGTTGNELGFTLLQSAPSNDLAVVFDASDPWNLVNEAAMRIPLADLGIDPDTDTEGDDLAITYTATKSTTPDTWLVGLSISNKTTTTLVGSVENVGIVNSTIYGSPSYFCVATAEDLSDGDTTNGVNTAGYEIDQMNVKILLDLGTLVGYEGYLFEHDLLYGDPDTLEGDDYDSDGLINIEEYAYGGDLTDNQDQGTLPQLVVSGSTASYYHVELKDPLSGITYTVETTDNIKDTGFTTPAEWDDTIVTDHDAFYSMIQNDLTSGDVYFYRTVVTTNAP